MLDMGYFESKQEFLLWLIPAYMPLMSLYEMIKENYNNLQDKFNKID